MQCIIIIFIDTKIINRSLPVRFLVESKLSRELGIGFIDARTIVTEAKLDVGNEGYYSDNQKMLILQESLNIFQRTPNTHKIAMKELQSRLTAIKNKNSSGSGSTTSSSNTEFASTTTSVGRDDTFRSTSSSSSSKRSSSTSSASGRYGTTFRLWPVRG